MSLHDGTHGYTQTRTHVNTRKYMDKGHTNGGGQFKVRTSCHQRMPVGNTSVLYASVNGGVSMQGIEF